jgi:hypothetical protein
MAKEALSDPSLLFYWLLLVLARIVVIYPAFLPVSCRASRGRPCDIPATG